MEVSHTDDRLESPALRRLGQFVRAHQQARRDRTPNFEQFECELHERVMALERELVTAELTRYDVDTEQIEVGGIAYHPVWADTETYLTAAGEVCVERHLYRPAGHNANSICPLELRVGIVDGYWTPRAAWQGSFVTPHVTPGESEALFEELGGMRPSRSSLDRLPRELSGHWEAKRDDWEVALRAQETVPEAAVSVALSVDGVMVAMKAKAANRAAKQSDIRFA